MFLSPEGKPLPWNTVNVTRILNRLLAAAENEKVDANGRKIDVYSLRSTCASALARRGVGLVIT